MPSPHTVVSTLLSELHGRKGFNAWWEGIDPDTRSELYRSLVGAADQALSSDPDGVLVRVSPELIKEIKDEEPRPVVILGIEQRDDGTHEMLLQSRYKSVVLDPESLYHFLEVWDVLDHFLGPGAGDVYDELDLDFPKWHETLAALRAASDEDA